jgi:hypothetical protein
MSTTESAESESEQLDEKLDQQLDLQITKSLKYKLYLGRALSAWVCEKKILNNFNQNSL